MTSFRHIKWNENDHEKKNSFYFDISPGIGVR